LQRSNANIKEMNQELLSLFEFFSKMGEVVDMNLEELPKFIVVTFTKHLDVLRILRSEKVIYNS
jgi:hypothetical protein